MKRILAILLLVSVGMFGVAGASAPGKSYALGKAKKCRVDYYKQTEKHRVGGKLVRYVACVYRAPVTVPGVGATTTTTTTVKKSAPTVAASTTAPTSTSSTTTTTTPPNYSERTSVNASYFMSDYTCSGGYYCYTMTAMLNTIGWPSPSVSTSTVGMVNFSWEGGAVSVPVKWSGLGSPTATATEGIPRQYASTITAYYSGGSYTDSSGGTVTVASAVG